MAIWSRNEKISGKRIKSVVGKAKTMGESQVPMKGGKTLGMDSPYYRHMKLGSEKDPLFLDEDGEVEIAHFEDVLGSREEAEIEVRDGRLWMTQGKHTSWFYILPPEAGRESFTPPENVKAEFTVDPSSIAKMSKKAKYVRIEAGINRAGERTVLIVYYDENMNFIDGMDLKTRWEGEPITAVFNAEDVSRWKTLGNSAHAKIYTDSFRNELFPGIELEGYDNGVPYDYVLPKNAATEIYAQTNFHDGGYINEEDRDWYMSCNRKRGRAGRGRR